MSYAEKTSVAWERSRSEIEQHLSRHGADGFAYAQQGDRAVIGFTIKNRTVRVELALPGPKFGITTPAGRTRTPSQASEARAQEVRRRWRSLALVIKAKLTAVADGISTVEREFLADVVLTDGRTIGEAFRPQLEASRAAGVPLLPPSSSSTEVLR